MVSSLSTTTRSSTGRWSPLGRATAVWTLTTSSWGPFDALSCLNEGQGAVAQLQSAGYAEHGADPGPGPRPVGCRTSARPVGRLGDGVGTDNCAYKSLGICAILRVRLLRRDGPSGGAHADCDSERHRARWPLSAMPSKVRGLFSPLFCSGRSRRCRLGTAKPEVSRTRVRRVLRARVHAVPVAVGLVAHV